MALDFPNTPTANQIFTSGALSYQWDTVKWKTVASTVNNNFNATSDPAATNDSSAGYAVGSLWWRSDIGMLWVCRSASVGAARWTPVGIADHSHHVAGHWHIPYPYSMAYSGQPAYSGTAGLIATIPFLIKERLTINNLAVYVVQSTASLGSAQVAFYANNPATNRPTGAALVSTGNLSTVTPSVFVSAAVSVQLEPGMYWMAQNLNRTDTALTGAGPSTQAGYDLTFTQLAGTPTLANAPYDNVLTTTQAYGTWPNLTSASWTENPGVLGPLVFYQVGSVP